MNDPIEKNVEWCKIPPTAKVTDLGSAYVVTFADGTKAVAFWGSLDRVKALAWLTKRAVLDKGKA